MDTFERYEQERAKTMAFVGRTIAPFIEYSSESGEFYGVLLVEMSTSNSKYRLQWYDERGFSGHYEVKSIADAIKELVSSLGYNLRLAPGSLDRLGPKTGAMWFAPGARKYLKERGMT